MEILFYDYVQGCCCTYALKRRSSHQRSVLRFCCWIQKSEVDQASVHFHDSHLQQGSYEV